MPLYLRILLLFLLNVALLFGALAWAAHRQMQSGLQSFLGTMVGANLQKAAEEMNDTLAKAPRSDWPGIAAKFENAHGVQTAVFASSDEIFAGSIQSLPPEVSAGFYPRMGGNTRQPGMGPPGMGPPGMGPPEMGPPEMGPPGRRAQRESGPPQEGAADAPPIRRIPGTAGGSGRDFPKGLIRTGEPLRYWAVASFPPMPPSEEGPPLRLMFAIATPSVLTCPVLFDSRPWLLGFGAAFLLSCLLWLPFVRGITGKLREMRHATGQMANGRLHVRIRENRRDEIGQLAASVNLMASQLDGYVSGQRRFTRDIAHELCSPISRMQAAAGVLDTGPLDARQRQYVDALDNELQHMSHLVQELLQFAKSTHHEEQNLSQVVLDPLIQTVIDRECGPESEPLIEVNVPNDLLVTAEPVLLSRAIGNVLRNALRYAGGDGKIEIAAAPDAQGHVVLSITDSGPGVPPESLPRLFDAFYRTDEARSPDQGGAGLGLAIVKHCIQSFGGTVSAENRQPRGLRVILTLPVATKTPRPSVPAPGDLPEV